MASTFLKSLSPTFQAMLVIEPCNGFSSMIKAASRIEHAIQDGLVQENDQPLKTAQRELELFPIASILPMNSTSQVYHSAQSYSYSSNTSPTLITQKKNIGPHPSSSKRTKREFTPLHYPINHMLTNLVNKGHLQLLPPRQPPNPLPKTYDVKKCCTYHQSFGHSTRQLLPAKACHSKPHRSKDHQHQ